MAAINLSTLFRVKFLNGLTESDWGTIPIAINPNFYELPHSITVYLEHNNQNHHQIAIPINKFIFSSIRNDSTSEVIPNVVLRRRCSDYMEMVEVKERDWENSLSLNSINIYYDLNYEGLRRFSHDAACSYSSGNGRSNSSSYDKVHHRRQCDVCFKFDNARNGSDETMSFHFCPNDVIVRDFRTTAGPIAPPSKPRRRRS